VFFLILFFFISIRLTFLSCVVGLFGVADVTDKIGVELDLTGVDNCFGSRIGVTGAELDPDDSFF